MVDPLMAHLLGDLIKKLKKQLKLTSIVVTHDMKSAFSISDRMAMIYRGEVIATGTPEDFRASKDPRVADFITGTAPVNEDVQTLLGA